MGPGSLCPPLPLFVSPISSLSHYQTRLSPGSHLSCFDPRITLLITPTLTLTRHQSHMFLPPLPLFFYIHQTTLITLSCLSKTQLLGSKRKITLHINIKTKKQQQTTSGPIASFATQSSLPIMSPFVIEAIYNVLVYIYIIYIESCSLVQITP